MNYLLDVNSLLALAVLEHEFHPRVSSWVEHLTARGIPEIATCSITELGFVRVLGQAPQYGSSVIRARELLLMLKQSGKIHFTFIPDNHDIRHLPKWAKTPKQTTDGHLVALARANESILATLDRRISGAFQIPQNRLK